MAPIMLPRDWLFLHPSYAALDQYLRWSQSRNGGQRSVDKQTGAILYSKDSRGYNLPTTVYRNLLDHLDHVYTKNGTGPSVLEKILEMLPKSDLKNLRSMSKSIGTAATKTICKTIRIPVDSFSKGTSGHKLSDFLTGFVDSARASEGAAADDGTLNLTFNLPGWQMNPDHVKELEFYPDPVAEEKMIRLFTDFNQQLEANDIFDPSLAARAARQEGKELIEHPRESDFQAVWQTILLLVERCENLEVFTWWSDVWQPKELLHVLAFNCTKLAKLKLNFTEPLFTDGFVDDRGPLIYQKQDPLWQNFCTLPSDIEVHLRVAVRRDEQILPILHHVGAFAKKVDTLTIDRSLSDDGCSAWEQGWDTDRPLMIDDMPIWPLDRAGGQEPLLEVRALQMINIGNKSRYVMPLLDTSGLRELVVNRCMNVEYILEPLVREAKYLTSVAILFGDDHEDYVEGPLRYHHLKVQDHRYALDFVRAGNFTLTDLLLHADFADSKRIPKTYSLLVPELWFAIQAHMATLVRLSVLNPQDDFRVTDIEELGRCSPHLQELRIQARMGAPIIDAPTPLTEGLAYSLKRALLAFRTHKTLRVFAIIKSDSWDINADEDPRLPKYVLDSNLEAVTNAIVHGVPIKLFTYLEEPWRKPATAHFYYNKTPFEPDVKWGVYPYPPAPVREDAQYFKGFEFHEQLPGLKGQSFNEHANKMLAKHDQLVKDLQLWHPYTKRGGATFKPEPKKIPSDTINRILDPISPDTYVGDFGDPRKPGLEGAALAERFARGKSYNPSKARNLGANLNIHRTGRALDWTTAGHPNVKKYYISKSTKKTTRDNPNKVKASRKEGFLRLSEEERNELFGKELPTYDPVPISERQYNNMTGRDLYYWEDLYSLLGQEFIDKLTILEAPLTDENREEKYELLDEYVDESVAWDIEKSSNFQQAKYALCARQRAFILKEAIAKKLVIPEPISENTFWDKKHNDILVWLHVNGYVNTRIYPVLTLSFALQPMDDVQKVLDDPTSGAYAQLTTLLDEVHDKVIPHARATGKILHNPITETEFNEIPDANLYDWAQNRHLISSSDGLPEADTSRSSYSRSGISVAEILAATYRGEILLRAAENKYVVLEARVSEADVRALSDEALYQWAVARKLLPQLSGTSAALADIRDEKAARAAAKRDDIVEKGIKARFIVASPIVPAPAGSGAARAHFQRGKMPVGGNRRGLAEYEEASEFVEGDEEEELRKCSKDELVLKVMGLCTDTPLAKELGMKGLAEAVSQYGKEELVGILLDGRERSWEPEEGEEFYEGEEEEEFDEDDEGYE